MRSQVTASFFRLVAQSVALLRRSQVTQNQVVTSDPGDVVTSDRYAVVLDALNS